MNTEKFEQLVEKFKTTLDITDNHLQMNSFAIKQNGDCLYIVLIIAWKLQILEV